MLMYKSSRISLVVLVLMFFGCTSGRYSTPDYMVLDEVVFVDKFPQTVYLEDPIQIELDEAFGAINFTIVDSLLIFSTQNPEGFWSFFSLPNYEWRGRFILKGNGPIEFTYSPSVGVYTSFYSSDKRLFAAIYDFAKGRVFEVDVSKTVENNSLSIRTVSDSLPPFLASMVMIDSVTFFCREITDMVTKEERYLLKNGIRNVPVIFNKLNRATIKPGEDNNILAAIIKYNSNIDRFVEMGLNLNYINIYSIDGSFGKTICTQKRLDNISDVQELNEADRMYRHAHLRLYENMFGALCINEEWGTYELGRKKLPEIQIFNMDGAPLVEIKLCRFATSFDFDFTNGYLYTYDFITEGFYKYNLPHTLSNLMGR